MKPAPPPRGEPPTAAAASPLIPVKRLWFVNGITVDIPHRTMGGASTGVTSTGPSPGAYHRIYFDPRLRHHRIEAYAPGAKTPDVRYVHEANTVWEPA